MDNQAVIKMIIRSLNAGARRCDTFLAATEWLFDWLFDRINLDPMIQVKYVDSSSQLADILIKGTFTRDEMEASPPVVQHDERFSLLSQPFLERHPMCLRAHPC